MRDTKSAILVPPDLAFYPQATDKSQIYGVAYVAQTKGAIAGFMDYFQLGGKTKIPLPDGNLILIGEYDAMAKVCDIELKA